MGELGDTVGLYCRADDVEVSLGERRAGAPKAAAKPDPGDLRSRSDVRKIS